MSGELAMHLLTKTSGLSWSIARSLSARKSDMTSLASLLDDEEDVLALFAQLLECVQI